ncbi:hypothetical protein AAE478_007783 [Parahypoxylon ruwenzoriense]
MASASSSPLSQTGTIINTDSEQDADPTVRNLDTRSTSVTSETANRSHSPYSSGAETCVEERREPDRVSSWAQLKRKARNAPNGANIGLLWDGSKGRYVAYKKDHFTGRIRPRVKTDDMWDSMSKEKLEEHRRRRNFAKSRQPPDVNDESETDGGDSRVE